MLSTLPLLEPRDSHALWYAPSRDTLTVPSASHNTPPHAGIRHVSHPHTSLPATGPLASLLLEEKAFSVRKQNIAGFGCAWIRPAGCTKTMLGLNEEDIERQEAAAGGGFVDDMLMTAPEDEEGLEAGLDGVQEEGGDEERDLDDDIPEANALVEEGEEAGDEDDLEAQEDHALMNRDLDDDVPEAFADEAGSDDQDAEPDLDQEIPSALASQSYLDGTVAERYLDAEDNADEQEWEHTDTDEDPDDNDLEEEEDMDVDNHIADSLLRSSISSAIPGPIPQLPPQLTPSRHQSGMSSPFSGRRSGGSPRASPSHSRTARFN